MGFMSSHNSMPRPLFDTLEPLCALYKRTQVDNQEKILIDWLTICLSDSINQLTQGAVHEYSHALRFLYNYRGSFETFNAYRREIDRLLQWCWFIEQKSFLELKRLDIEHFIEFCQKPPKRWIGFKMVSRFITKSDFPSETPSTGWGVSDLALFDRSALLLEDVSKTKDVKIILPMILTVSNHIPWVVPDDASLDTKNFI